MQVLEIQPKDLEEQNLVDVKIDPIFRKLNKNAICFHIWKVEQDRIEPVSKTSYGTFYDNCTYIVYAASMPGTYSNLDTITREIKNPTNIERFIHFWLGSTTTAQKSGNVAYKVMELDTHFEHMTTQYRETQGNESSRFLSYFKKGITILCSEVAEANAVSRLYRVNGKKWIMCVEMNCVDWQHFGSSYIMLLQTPKYIFVWLGRSSSPTERRNAWDVAIKIQEEHGISEITIVDDGYEQSMNEPQKQEWNKYLSLTNRFVNQLVPVGQIPAVTFKLYKCGYHVGKYRIEELKTNEPQQTDLNDSDVAFIIDGSLRGVWVWVGRKSSVQEKVEAMRNARGFVKKKKYPSSTPVIKVMEGYEPLEFQRLFPVWKKPMESSSSKQSNILGKLDSLTLLQRPKMAAETQLIDDGTGEKHIFRITDGKFIELPKQKHVAFFSGDCYILHYYLALLGSPSNQSPESRGIESILYVWNGRDTGIEKRQKCENLARDYFRKLTKQSMMVKLVDGLETPHFLQIFGGKFVVFSGQGSEYDRNGLSSLSPNGFILKVIGDSTYNSKAIQHLSLLRLSSKDCFVVKSRNVWVWCGQSSTGDAREVAKNIGGLLGEYTLIMESKEPEEFWESVLDKFVEKKTNGFTASVSPAEQSLINYDKSRAGLSIGYIDQGSIVSKEILGFEQSDLTPEDVYLMDAGSMIFIWLGVLCSTEERDLLCWAMARDYLQNYPVHRDENTAIALIRQECEPNIFVGFFNTWDPNFWKNHISFDTIRQSMESYVSPVASFLSAINGESDFDKHQKYPISVLQQEADSLPTGIDPIRKEIHLTHDDFVSIFQMKFSEFDTLPAWRKQELKKKHKLF